VHVCASLLAGVASTLGLRVLFGTPPPTPASLVAAACVVCAAIALSYPAMNARLAARFRAQVLLFVCGGNTARSPMAEAFARAELATNGHNGLTVRSAGINPRQTGAPMAAPAVEVLHRLGVTPHRHRSRQLTAEMCRKSFAVFCMTQEQRAAIVALAPDAASRVFCLDPSGDIPEPTGSAFLEAAQRIRGLVQVRLREVQPQGGA
jgi:protein-tyrosine-phosphatase